MLKRNIKFVLLLFFILQGCITHPKNSNNRAVVLEKPQKEETLSYQIAKTTILTIEKNTN